MGQRSPWKVLNGKSVGRALCEDQLRGSRWEKVLWEGLSSRVTARCPGAGASGAMVSRHNTAPQFMQKKNPLYALLKDDTVWSMDHLNHYINDKFRKAKGLPQDWVFTTFTVCMLLTHPRPGGGAEGQGPLGYVGGGQCFQLYWVG